MAAVKLKENVRFSKVLQISEKVGVVLYSASLRS